jgi:peptidoglycan hydrolase-like protein with peptidoglycan-binding domain
LLVTPGRSRRRLDNALRPDDADNRQKRENHASDVMSAALPQDASAQYDNLGLNTARAKNWQRWLKDLGQNPGTIDGKLETASRKAARKEFRFRGSDVDGIAGPKTIKGLYKHLNYWGGYGLAVDGKFGAKTKDAFWKFNA